MEVVVKEIMVFYEKFLSVPLFDKFYHHFSLTNPISKNQKLNYPPPPLKDDVILELPLSVGRSETMEKKYSLDQKGPHISILSFVSSKPFSDRKLSEKSKKARSFLKILPH